MTASRPSDWATSPHHTAAVADATQAAITTARRELKVLDEALQHLQANYRFAVETGDKARAAVVKTQIARTEAKVAERRALLEAKP